MKDGAFALFSVPDIKVASAFLAHDKVDHALFSSPAGPITPLDLIYGHQDSLKKGHIFRAHNQGFTPHHLAYTLRDHGFPRVTVTCDGFDVIAQAFWYTYDNPERVERLAISPRKEEFISGPDMPKTSGSDAPMARSNRRVDELDQEPKNWKPLRLALKN